MARSRTPQRWLLGISVLSLSAALLTPGAVRAQEAGRPLDRSLEAYRERMRSQDGARSGKPAEARLALRQESAIQVDDRQVYPTDPSQPPRAALLVEPPVSTQPAPGEVLGEIPDPTEADRVFASRLKRIEELANGETRVVDNYQRVIAKAREYLSKLKREKQYPITLAECVQRALQNNYSIRIEAFNPRISRMDVVRAEAAFDTVFFLDANYQSLDQPVPSQLSSSVTDNRALSGGLRKLLPTGMTVETSMAWSRNSTDNQFVTLNPSHSTSWTTTFTQPLLRGFGLDYNRAFIESNRLAYKGSVEQYMVTVRDRLLEVEQAYWSLLSARRNVMVLAELVAQNYATYENMKIRLEHDATPVEVANSRSRWKRNEVEYQTAVKRVKDFEDELKNLLNDSDLTLADDVELVPTETPFASFMSIDQFAEVRSALENRNELTQVKLQIEQARIDTSRAKNETLPQLNLRFQYTVEGLGNSADNSFDDLKGNDFESYVVGVSFEVPIGQRDAYARLMQARARESQLIVQLHQTTDDIVQEVNNSVRNLVVGYENIPSALDSVLSAERNLRALQARTDRIDPNFLQTELSGVQELANNRQRLLQVVTDYNVAIIRLERDKGTLLRYNNVVVSDEPTPR